VLPAGRAEIPPLMWQRMRRRQASTLEDPLLPVYSHVDARVRGAHPHVQLHRKELFANLSAEYIAGGPTSMVGGLECLCFR